MQFRIIHEFPALPSPIQYTDRLMAIGSCFAENMGVLLKHHKFQTRLNPSGILFNPMSIASNLQFYLDPKTFQAEEQIFEHQGLFHSWMHHGVFSRSERNEIKQNITDSLQTAQQDLMDADYLMITWGSAFVFEIKKNKQLVANCHKVPAQQFHKRLLEVDEIVAVYTKLIKRLLSEKPNLKIIWSISPVKYIKDGLFENNLSKSVLFLALNQLLHQFPNQFYFPAFELVQDELRDYRFYAEDMAHPNELAIQFIWNKFVSHAIAPEALVTLDKIAEINQAMAHRPLHPDTGAYEKFRLQQLLKVKQLQSEYPMMDWEKELVFFS